MQRIFHYQQLFCQVSFICACADRTGTCNATCCHSAATSENDLEIQAPMSPLSLTTMAFTVQCPYINKMELLSAYGSKQDGSKHWTDTRQVRGVCLLKAEKLTNSFLNSWQSLRWQITRRLLWNPIAYYFVYWSLLWAIWIRFTHNLTPYLFKIFIIPHLHLDLLSDLFSSDYTIKIVNAFLIFLLHSICAAHLILLELKILIILGEAYVKNTCLFHDGSAGMWKCKLFIFSWS